MSDEELICRIVHDIGHYAASESMTRFCRTQNITYKPDPQLQLHRPNADKQRIAALIEKGNKNQLSGLELAYYQSYQYGLQQLKNREQIQEISPELAKRVIEQLHLSNLKPNSVLAKPSDSFGKFGFFCCVTAGIMIGHKLSPYLFPRKQ